MKKLIEPFEIDGGKDRALEMSEEKATLLYLLDIYNKHLIEIDAQPLRKVRDTLDGFVKALVQTDKAEIDRALFDLRQWFASYRLDEATYIQNTFDDFKRIVWDFADQLGEDIKDERAKDHEVNTSLEALREAVESNSIDALRSKSREFINLYIEHQLRKDEQRQKRMSKVRRSLDSVKKQLIEANQSMRADHLTGAFNRRSFDERLKNQWRLFELERTPCTLILLDIDHFKKINDSYGHDIGDFVLKECVSLLQGGFNRENDVVARVGGEEFAVILPGLNVDAAVAVAEAVMERIRKEVFVHGELQIRFTVSMGIAELHENDDCEGWLKKADTALYQSKNSGRNRWTIAGVLKAA